MDIMLDIIVFLTIFVIVVNIATTILPKFRRWIYSNDRS